MGTYETRVNGIGVWVAASLVPVVFVCGEAVAGGRGPAAAKEYEVKHAFSLPVQYPAGIALEPTVSMVLAGKTLATNPGVSDPDSFGPVTHLIPAAGGTKSDFAVSLANVSSAIASATGTVDAFLPGAAAITGSYKVDGLADANPVVPGFANAFSSVAIHATGRAKLGNVIRFGPEKMKAIAGGTRQRSTDPLSIRISDPDSGSTLFDEMLFDTTFDLTDGSYLWEGGVLNIDAWEGDFRIVIPGVVTAESGELAISLKDGAVVSANATGIFGGVNLPAIGETSALSLNLQSMFDLTFVLPGLDATKAYDYDFGMSSQGEAVDAIVPGPTALSSATLLGFVILGGRQRRR